jgi:hypothetical protein
LKETLKILNFYKKNIKPYVYRNLLVKNRSLLDRCRAWARNRTVIRYRKSRKKSILLIKVISKNTISIFNFWNFSILDTRIRLYSEFRYFSYIFRNAFTYIANWIRYEKKITISLNLKYFNFRISIICLTTKDIFNKLKFNSRLFF